MLKTDAHKRALDRLEELIDLDHVRSCEQVHMDAWTGRTPERMPCFIGFPPGDGWPSYPFTECWNDLERNFMTAMSSIYCGAALKDDRLYTLAPHYGVVNIPETSGVRSIITDQGNAMSAGLHDLREIRALIDRGIPELGAGHGAKVEAFFDFAGEVLSQYEKLAQVVHCVVPDNQGPFDLAHLVWGHEILFAIHDHPDVVHPLVDLMTRTYLAFTHFYKQKTGEPLDSGYHICGIRLARGGVRICDDSAVLCSAEVYREFIKPYNVRVFAPFGGGWLHYCGNGNHLLDDMLSTPGVNAIHMGNPDHRDLIELYTKTRTANVFLIWSGSLERMKELRASAGGCHPTGMMVLTENRYASANLEQARKDLERVRNDLPIPKAPY